MHHHSTRIQNTDFPVNPYSNFSAPVLLTVKQFAEKHIGFSQGALRGLIFNSKSRPSSVGEIPSNGLEVSLVRVGRKLLINEQKFYEWLERQGS